VDLADSDRAWQPIVRALWNGHTQTRPADSRVVLDVTAASKIPYRVIVRRCCGQALIGRSLTVTVGRLSQPACDACAETMFFIDRTHRPLIYYVH